MTFLQGLGRCQGACGSRVKVGWLITTSPPSEALGRVLGASPTPPARPREGRSEGNRLSQARGFGRWGWRTEGAEPTLGLTEEDATGGRNDSGYSFKVDPDTTTKAFSKTKLGAPASPGPGPLAVWRAPSPRSYFRLNCILCLVEGGAFLTEARPDPTFVFRARVQPGACPTVSAHPAGPTRTATFWAPALWSRGRDQ